MCPMRQKRIAALKMANTVSAIDGTPIFDYARALSASWVWGELTGGETKYALLAYHRKLSGRERRGHV